MAALISLGRYPRFEWTWASPFLPNQTLTPALHTLPVIRPSAGHPLSLVWFRCIVVGLGGRILKVPAARHAIELPVAGDILVKLNTVNDGGHGAGFI